MKLYNTASRRLETVSFGPEVPIYVCGITPYDAAHLGHVYTFATYDVLQRLLERRGHRVKLVRNITDVDEPIYAKAAELGEPYQHLAARETAHFQEVMRQLKLRPAYAEPKASDYIEAMAKAVEQLLDQGQAYRLDDGDIYFDTATVPHFGAQSGLPPKLQLAFMAERGGDPQRPGKRQPLDFLLWKAVSDPADPAQWPTAVGNGRPGWHIECSVMSTALLPTPLAIHGGGMDLIFPHHEAETAQSQALGHTPFVQHWMHVAPLYYYGEKMSKSLGNLVFAGDLLRSHPAEVIRLALLQYHYRIGGEWHNDVLTHAGRQLAHIRAAADKRGPDPAAYLRHFYDALDDDLDTPAALQAMLELAADTTTKGGDVAVGAALGEMLSVLGLAD